MTNDTLTNEIQILINNTINQIPYPTRCTITRVHSNTRIDIKTDNGELEQVECIANNPTIGNTGILVFLNGGTNDYIVITK